MERVRVRLRQVVLDTTDPRGLAEFYRRLLGFAYRPGDGTGPADWLVLHSPDGGRNLAFQRVAEPPAPTWPDGPRPQMLHLDLTVATPADLDAEHARVLELGGRLLRDRAGDPREPLRVYADPAGHPFCIFVAAPAPPAELTTAPRVELTTAPPAELITAPPAELTAAPPAGLIAAVRAAHARLEAAVAGLDDPAVRGPSRLPGWTVGHLVTHLARNADSVARRLAAAAEGRLVEQYPGDRDGEIEAGAHRPAAALAADLAGADAAVDALFAAVPAGVWGRPVLDGSGARIPAARLAYSRLREVEIHHVDLGLGYSPADWPAGLVEVMLPGLLSGLPDRADPAALAAWLLDRSPAPALSSWDT